jgi:hypothetical protein
LLPLTEWPVAMNLSSLQLLSIMDDPRPTDVHVTRVLRHTGCETRWPGFQPSSITQWPHPFSESLHLVVPQFPHL